MTSLDFAKWQVSPNFAPDKESTWKGPKEEDGWFHAHNAIRGEIRDLIDGVEFISTKVFPKSNSLPSWVVESIQTIWLNHEEHVHSHHDNEEKIMFPFMKERIVIPEKLEADHATLLKHMEEIKNEVKSLKEGSSLTKLQQLLSAYEQDTLPHLKEEEDIALPLLRAYFEEKEVDPVTQKMVGGSPDSELGSFIHYMTEDVFRSKFMKDKGIPFFVWYLVFKKQHAYFLKNVLVHLDALKTGIPPTVNKGCLPL